MGMIGRLVKVIKVGVGGKRTWTPQEVRELIERGQLPQARHAVDRLSASLLDRDAEMACLRGEIAFQEHDDEAADRAFRQALAAVPALPSAHYGLSLLLASRGDFDPATQHAQFALGAEPLEPRFLAQLGYCHLALGNVQIAEQPLRKAIHLKPENAYAWNNLGIVLRSKGQLAEARDCFRRAVDLRPDFTAAQAHLTQSSEELQTIEEARGSGPAPSRREVAPKTQKTSSELLESTLRLEAGASLEAAIDECEKVALQHPLDPAPVIELQRLYDRQGDPQSGIDALEAFVANQPDALEAVAALGLAYARVKEHAKAETPLLRALEAEPERVELLMALAQTHFGQGAYTKAMAPLERARALAPDDELIRGHYAAGLSNLCRYDEALAICEEVRAEGKEIACYGAVLAYLGRFDEALAWLDRALMVQPSDPNLRFQRAQIHLLRYEFAAGWDDYAYRGLSYSKDFRVLPFTHWRGEPLQGKRIVVLAEQGLGDQVMLASCLPDLLRMEPAEVVVEAIGRIAPTIERSFPQCKVIASWQDSRLDWVKDCGEMDYFVPLGDLPKYFRRSIDAFPRHEGYLKPDPARVLHWKKKLAEHGPGPYVGLSWRGGNEITRTSLRSMPAPMLAPLTRSGPATFVCLQYGNVADALREAADAGLPMVHWPEAIANLDEFAALIGALDLVITVCNTTVHYAGAVAKPVWVLSPHIPEWRYGVEGATMPWYPSSRVFRQAVDAEGWSSTIAIVGHELSAWLAARATPALEEEQK